MNIHTTRSNLLSAIELAEKLVSKKDSVSVLSCIVIDAQNSLSIRATNLESGIDIRVAADISEKGTIAVAAHILFQTIRSIQADTIQLKIEESNLVIESRGTHTLIKSISPSDFPLQSIELPKTTLSLSREQILKGFKSVMYAASRSMIRPELGSVYISIEESSVICVATDSFRLAERTVPNAIQKKNKQEISDVLIPIKHINEIVFILEHLQDDFFDCCIEESQLTIANTNTRFVCRVIDAQFPQYKEIIPKTISTEVVLLRNDLTEALRKARVFSGKEQQIGVHIYPARKICTITARSNDIGEMSDSIDAVFKGDDIDINFNVGYLMDCFSVIESDSVSLNFSGTSRPLVIKGVSDPTFTYLVMPLNR